MSRTNKLSRNKNCPVIKFIQGQKLSSGVLGMLELAVSLSMFPASGATIQRLPFDSFNYVFYNVSQEQEHKILVFHLSWLFNTRLH